ncbi:DNA ligase [Hypsizygus marmoreus]|uniref:DNA ligase n=1 Tax=Hypsizygus marmoreus TaxID=39966 RepID=A0A369JD65_HYPMA|nr:DNA ligase [Hypsizygus marmoreus]
MSQDELAEIDGIKPNVLLADGEEKEVSSMSSNSVYKVKRTFDHFYCTCPAWRNQSGAPVNARTCKHLKSLLGDKYEAARLKSKNPHGPPPKGPAKKPASKAKAKPPSASKRKKADDAADEDVEDNKPAKKARKPVSTSKGKGKGKKDEDEDEDEEEEGEDEEEGEEPPPTSKVVPELLLANKWDIETGPDPVGWWISEKLDGVRTYYDGKQMISRLGNPFTPPDWFLEKLPKDVTLDGELFGGRGEFQSTVSIVKTINSPHWKDITFQIFDIPSRGHESFEDRITFLKNLFGPGGSHASELVQIVEHELATSRTHVLDKLKEIETLGGEGLMLRKPASLYEGRRSATLLKIKTFYDAEAIVTGYVPGKGRNKGVTGALKCKMESGKTFNVGTGLSDKLRRNPPKIGAIITYRFQDLTKDGVPRFPSYIGEAIDKDEPKDAEIPEHRKSGAKVADA